VDAVVAANVTRWPSMTQAHLSGKVDAIMAGVDADAVRRRTKERADREIWIGGDQDGIARIEGSLFNVDAHALDQRLSKLAATVCAHDPRTQCPCRALRYRSFDPTPEGGPTHAAILNCKCRTHLWPKSF
jgi:Domain of unknown function (DUF222)